MTPTRYLDEAESLRYTLVAYARQFCVVNDDAQDAVQIAIMLGYEKLHLYNSAKGSLKQWLHRLVEREAKTFSRTKYRERADVHQSEEHGFSGVDTGEEGRPLEPRGDVRRAKKRAVEFDEEANEPGYTVHYELRHDLAVALDSLEETQRNVFLDRHLLEMTVQEVAEKRGMSVNQVVYKERQARSALKLMLGGEGGYGGGTKNPCKSIREVSYMTA